MNSPWINVLTAHINGLLHVTLRRAAVLTRPLHGAGAAGRPGCVSPGGAEVNKVRIQGKEEACPPERTFFKHETNKIWPKTQLVSITAAAQQVSEDAAETLEHHTPQ